MKKILLVFFVLFWGKLNAQSYELVIRMNDQSETVWTHESLRNIIFDGETTLIVVENESLATHQYDLAEINKIYFKNGVAITELNKDEASFVFPNPAKDKIKIFGVENQEIAATVRVTANATQIEPIIVAPFLAIPMLLMLLIGLLIPKPKKRRLD